MPDMPETPEAGSQTQSNGCILSLWTRFVGHPAPVQRLSATRSALIQTFPNSPAGYTRQVVDGLLQYQLTRGWR